MTPGRFRHELAHAWDDVRADRHPQRLDELPLAQRTRAVERLSTEVESHHAMSSSTDPRLRDSFEEYAHGRSWNQAEYEAEAFDTPGTQGGYSRRSVEEFYAEGFSAFHGDAERAARLQRNAPELYRQLAAESQQEGTLPAWVDPSSLAVQHP